MQSHSGAIARQRLAKKSASNVIAVQSVIALVIVVLLAIFGGLQDSFSALLAGLICVIANSYFAKRIFRYQSADAKRFIKAYLLGELTKLGIIIVLMLFALMVLKIKALPFLLTFVVLQITMSFVPLMVKNV